MGDMIFIKIYIPESIISNYRWKVYVDGLINLAVQYALAFSKEGKVR